MLHDAPRGDEPEPRREAALAGHTGDGATARRAASHPDGAVRATALGALARLGRLSASDLLGAFTDPDPRVRRRAAELAARVEGSDPSTLVTDPDPSVVEAAIWALGERPGPDPGDLVPLLAELAAGHPDALCREAAVAALGAMGHPDGLATVLAALTDRPAVRRRAVVALAGFDDPRADDAIVRALTDRDRQVRAVAEELLGSDADGPGAPDAGSAAGAGDRPGG